MKGEISHHQGIFSTKISFAKRDKKSLGDEIFTGNYIFSRYNFLPNQWASYRQGNITKLFTDTQRFYRARTSIVTYSLYKTISGVQINELGTEMSEIFWCVFGSHVKRLSNHLWKREKRILSIIVSCLNVCTLKMQLPQGMNWAIFVRNNGKMDALSEWLSFGSFETTIKHLKRWLILA